MLPSFAGWATLNKVFETYTCKRPGSVRDLHVDVYICIYTIYKIYKKCKYTKVTKYEFIENKKKSRLKCFEIFGRKKNRMFECILSCLVYFKLSIDILNMLFGLCVFFSIYEVENKYVFEKCPRSVNNSRTKYFGGYVVDCWSPYVAEASLGRV